MRGSIKIKAGTFQFDTEETTDFFNVSHPVFQAIENFGHSVIECQSKEVQSMYYGSFDEMYGGSYYSVKGAVKEAILNMFSWVEETGKTQITSKMFYEMELDVAFEG
jgi:hypothetical protein